MMLKAITLDQSRLTRHLMFIGVNVAFVALAYFFLVAPVQHFLVGGAESVAERQATLARYQVVAAQEQAVQDYVKQVQDSNGRGELLEGASEGVVNANLQARLKAFAEKAGVTVRSIQALPVKNLREATLIGARIETFGRLEAVHSLVRSMEDEAPILLVMSAVMRQQAAFWDSAAATDQSIEAQFDVYGGASPKERP